MGYVHSNCRFVAISTKILMKNDGKLHWNCVGQPKASLRSMDMDTEILNSWKSGHPKRRHKNKRQICFDIPILDKLVINRNIVPATQLWKPTLT